MYFVYSLLLLLLLFRLKVQEYNKKRSQAMLNSWLSGSLAGHSQDDAWRLVVAYKGPVIGHISDEA